MNAAERARSIVTALVIDDVTLACAQLDDHDDDTDTDTDLDVAELERVIIHLSTDVAALVRRLAFLTGMEPLEVWQHVVMSRVIEEAAGG